MDICVNGAAGRMGRLVVKNAVEANHKVVQAFDVREIGKDAGELAGIGKIGTLIQEMGDLDCDVAIDFSVPEATVELVKLALKSNTKLVIGTTGLNDEQKKVIEEASRKIPIVMSPNFSVGVNVFWKILEVASKLLKEYDVEIVEVHHRFKRDAPSGTALKAAEIVKNELGVEKLVFGRSGECLRGDEIGVMAIRGGDVVGEHFVMFIGFGERIEINHRAWSREIFARGAIKAAEWIMNVDKPGLYGMKDVLGV